MANEDIRDLLGRYATGSLTAEERKRLFDAALDDQDLFEELAREDEMKELFGAPGVRDRLIHALEPPKRRPMPWILALAPVALLSAVLMVILMRPVPKPQQVAIVTTPSPPAVSVPPPTPLSEPKASEVSAPVKKKALNQPQRDTALAKNEDKAESAAKKDAESRLEDQKQAAVSKDAAPKAADQVSAAPPPVAPAPLRAAPQQARKETQTVEVQAQASQIQAVTADQQNSPGGPKQNAVQSARALGRAAGAGGKIASTIPRFGFHYSIQTAGHLIVIPSVDGYLSVKSADGAVLFAPQRIAAGALIDIDLLGATRSLSILFSADATPAPLSSTVRTAPEGTVQAPAGAPLAIAIELKLKP